MPSQLDYLIFAASVLAILGVTVVVLRRWKSTVRLGLVWWSISLFILIAGGWFTEREGREAGQNLERSLVIMARTYALDLTRLDHAKITLESTPEDPAFKTIAAAIRDWRTANPSISAIYTMRRDGDGTTRLIVDPENDLDKNGVIEGETEQMTEIGEVFDEPDAGLELALVGTANFNPEIVEDRWGRWVGAWAPVRDPLGKIEAVVGVDYGAEEWLSLIGKARRDAMMLTVLLLSIAAISGATIGILRADLVHRLEMERRTRDSDERLSLTIRQLPLAFIEWTPQAQVAAWNPSAEKIFGFSQNEAVGRSMFPEIVAPSAREHVDRIFAELTSNRGGSHSINENLTKDGRIITCEWFNTPLVDSAGKVIAVFSLAQDITERMNLEKHVAQSQRLNAVGQLAAGVAHDFNNILTIITGHIGLLLDRSDLAPEVRSDLERVDDAAVRAAALTRQLLAFSRQQAMFPRPLRINEIVKGSVAMLTRVIGENIHFNVHLADGLPAVNADPAMLDQVITNLAINSRDAMHKGGNLTIATAHATITAADAQKNPEARAGQFIRLSVTDTGSGIALEHLARIFEPFFTTKQMGKGTGLGLAVVHGIVRQHHGWIEATSAVGKGTSMSIFLPPTDKPAESLKDGRRKAAHEIEPHAKTILVVEDEAVVRELAVIILERSGYRVFEAEDGPAALRIWAIQRDEIDLLLTDMVMPNGITGRDLSMRLLADRPELPVIYASGYSQELTAPDFVEGDRRKFLQKPYMSDQLLEMVKRCIEV